MKNTDLEEMRIDGYIKHLIVREKQYFSAKELTLYPGSRVTIRDRAAYGLMVIQGRGTFGGIPVESPNPVRFGHMTNYELFVTVKAAREGITTTNTSDNEDLVILKHFRPAVSGCIHRHLCIKIGLATNKEAEFDLYKIPHTGNIEMCLSLCRHDF